jgi:ATP-dependent helicase/nuclease subunit B
MPISCPAPKPASIFRPTRLSVTEIEKLMRDPYWIYARKILNLKKLEDVDADLSAADFGNFIHQALDHFSMYFKTTSKESWHELLLDSGRHVLQNMLDRPVIKSLWWPRFERIASWIVNREIDNISSNKIFTEIRGKIIIDGFELIAKADRLEIDPSDHIILIDYKTGTLPTLTSIKKGISSQMILEALIACGKGFTTQNPLTHYESSKIIYIRLTGGEIAGEELIIDKDIAELLEEASVGVSNLIRAFSDSNTAYLPSPLPDRILQFNDYDHLARTKEWS